MLLVDKKWMFWGVRWNGQHFLDSFWLSWVENQCWIIHSWNSETYILELPDFLGISRFSLNVQLDHVAVIFRGRGKNRNGNWPELFCFYFLLFSFFFNPQIKLSQWNNKFIFLMPQINILWMVHSIGKWGRLTSLNKEKTQWFESRCYRLSN